ncbi:MAG: flagellin [Candidatus Poribacteria bacterium]|nr:flagellin [Candidatus Poribacteria bacterium]
MFRINHNISSLTGQRHLSKSDRMVGEAVERLSSGLRINRAADDAAGLFISEQMRAQIAGMNMAMRNVQNAVSLLQTAEGGMDQMGEMLMRLKELGVQAADGTYTDTNRGAMQLEASALLLEISRISQAVSFNGLSLLQGNSFTFQVGDTSGSTSRFNVRLGPVTLGSILPGVTSVDWGNQVSAIQVLNSIEFGINSVAAVRTEVGAAQNRLERAFLNLQVQVENTTSAESVIRDADFAAETAALTRALILVQSGTSVLGQANLLPQNALSLIQF